MIRFLLLSTVLFLASCSPKLSKDDASVDPNAPLEKTLLWEISGKGLSKPSYLYGTIHIIPAKDYFLPPHTEEKLLKTKRLVMELDMSKQLEMAMEMMASAPMKDGVTLKSLVPEKDYEMVKKYYETEVPEVKMTGFSFFENFKPFFLTSMLYTKMAGGGEMKTYELEFLDIAKKNELEVGGLETLSEQMSVFDSIPYKEQAEELVKSVQDLVDGKGEGMEEAQKMVDVYKSQDTDGMYAFTSSEDSEVAGNLDVLLHNRNRNWISRIAKMAKEKPTFFAVGAGHLGGPQGVIRLLRKEGFKVTPVLQ